MGAVGPNGNYSRRSRSSCMGAPALLESQVLLPLVLRALRLLIRGWAFATASVLAMAVTTAGLNVQAMTLQTARSGKEMLTLSLYCNGYLDTWKNCIETLKSAHCKYHNAPQTRPGLPIYRHPNDMTHTDKHDNQDQHDFDVMRQQRY